MNDDPNEEWRPVRGMEAAYDVSNLGRVRSKPRPGIRRPTRTYGGKVLQPSTSSPDGYARVVLRHGERTRFATVGRLVCEAFHGPRPSERHEVAHSDGDRGNDRADNLRWATHRENEADKRQHGTVAKGSLNGSARIDAAAARRIMAWDGHAKDIAEAEGVSEGLVYAIWKGRRWRHLFQGADGTPTVKRHRLGRWGKRLT